MPGKIEIAIIGPGRLGRCLVLQLTKTGYFVREVVSHSNPDSVTQKLAAKVGARATTSTTAVLNAGLIWLCVPDSEIARTARALVRKTTWKGKIVFHSSGALPSDELGALRKRGASVAAVHPLMTFVRNASPSLERVPFAVEGDRSAVRLARAIIKELRGEFFRITKQQKAAYHAFGAFTSPLVVALLASAEQVARAAGMKPAVARKRMVPIVTQTLANYAKLGPGEAFTGPIARGDAATVRKHLRAFERISEVKDVYEALARSALRYLPSKNREELRKVLPKKT